LVGELGGRVVVTIAGCYPSPEGIIFGADSTSTALFSGGHHYFNHNQKIFEVGSNSTIAAVTWGLGNIGKTSLRTLLAVFAEQLVTTPPTDMAEVANRWAQMLWPEYTSALKPSLDLCRILATKVPHDPGDPTSRTQQEERQFQHLSRALILGFCIGGTLPAQGQPGLIPRAFEIVLDPLAAQPDVSPVLGPRFWGVPMMTDRLLYGCDDRFRAAVLGSGFWKGTEKDFDDLRVTQTLNHGLLPIRDAVDFVHTCVYTTIKAMKFSNFNQICGGPIELAVITTDRPFRWVRHKSWDAAIQEGI